MPSATLASLRFFIFSRQNSACCKTSSTPYAKACLELESCLFAMMPRVLPHPVKAHLCYSSFLELKRCPPVQLAHFPQCSSWLRKGDGRGFLFHRNGLLLARAEDRPRDSSYTSSNQHQLNNQVLLFIISLFS